MMRKHTSLAFIFGLLLLARSLWAFSPSQFPPRQGASTTTTRLLDTNENKGYSDETDSNSNTLSNVLSRAKQLAKKGGSDVMSVASATGSGVKSIAGATGSGIKTAAGATASRLTGLTEKGTAGAKLVAGAATSGVSQLAEKGTSDLKSVANAAGSTLIGLAEKGGSDVKSVANATTSGISQRVRKSGSDVMCAATTATSFAEKGTSDVKSAVNVAASGLSALVDRGGLDVTSLAQWLDSQAKGTASVARDTVGAAATQGKAVAKVLIERTASSECNLSDLMLLLKVLVMLGASFGPLAKILPVTILLDLLNVSLEARLGGKILEVLAESLDERFSAAFTAQELGDLAKRSLTAAILTFTGKQTYEAGDIERAVAKECDEETSSAPVQQKTLELSVGPEFAQWDEAFRESCPDIELAVAESLDVTQNSRPSEIVSELEEWDRKFRERYPEAGL